MKSHNLQSVFNFRLALVVSLLLHSALAVVYLAWSNPGLNLHMGRSGGQAAAALQVIRLKEKAVVSQKGSQSSAQPYSAAVVQNLQQGLQLGVSYPLLARKMGWQGSVTVEISLKAGGLLRSVRVVNSSGYAVFDNEVLRQARLLSFPAGAAAQSFLLKVNFLLK